MNVFLQNGLSQVSLEDFDTSPCKTFMNALILRGMTVAPTLKRGKEADMKKECIIFR